MPSLQKGDVNPIEGERYNTKQNMVGVELGGFMIEDVWIKFLKWNLSYSADSSELKKSLI